MTKTSFFQQVFITFVVTSSFCSHYYSVAMENSSLELAATQHIWRTIQDMATGFQGSSRIAAQLPSSITNDFDINLRNNEGLTPLLYLLTHGPDNFPAIGTSAEHQQRVLAYRDLLEKFIKRGARVNAKDSNGRDGLMLAIIKNNSAFVRLLLKYRAHVTLQHISQLFNQLDNKDLVNCNISTSFQILELLLPYFRLPFDWMEQLLQASNASYKSASEALKKKIDSEASLTRAFARQLIETLLLYCREPYDDLAEELYGMFIGNQMKFLELAIRRNAVDIFCQRGGDLSGLLPQEKDALILVAAQCLKVDIVKVLLVYQANADYCSKKNETPLRAAVEAYPVDGDQATKDKVVELLLQHGARVETSDYVRAKKQKLLLSKARESSIINMLIPRYRLDTVRQLILDKFGKLEKNINWLKNMLSAQACSLDLLFGFDQAQDKMIERVQALVECVNSEKTGEELLEAYKYLKKLLEEA